MAAPVQRKSGTVARKLVAHGSKSEREAVVLVTRDGAEFILRRKGGNAFSDPQLDELVGSSITADGHETGQTFIMTTWNRSGPDEG